MGCDNVEELLPPVATGEIFNGLLIVLMTHRSGMMTLFDLPENIWRLFGKK